MGNSRELNAEGPKTVMPEWRTILNSGVNTEDAFKKALSDAQKNNQIDGYPEQQVLISRAFFYLNSNRLGDAEKDFKAALEIARNSLNQIWTDKLTADERLSYLPAYSNASEERQGKYHAIANILGRLADIKYRQGNLKIAQEYLDETFKILDEKLSTEQATIVRISTYGLQARILESQGKIKEASSWADKASKLSSSLDR